MTLTGKKNHYNVKLLRGYGVSINLKDNRIILKNGQHDIIGKSETKDISYLECIIQKLTILPVKGRDVDTGQMIFHNLAHLCILA